MAHVAGPVAPRWRLAWTWPTRSGVKHVAPRRHVSRCASPAPFPGHAPTRALVRWSGEAVQSGAEGSFIGMRTLGIVGGLGPESTVDYYRAIQDRFHERHPGAGDPPLVITSLDSDRMRAYFDAWDLAAVADWLVAEFERLTRAGADFGLIAANTPHIVFPEVQGRCSLPLVSIVEATCDKTVALGLGRVGLLGTKFTMRERFFPDVFERHAIQVFVPDARDQAFIHEKYFSELFVGVFREETRRALADIARKLIERERIQGLILGGTELPLILRDAPDLGVPLLDTTRIHVEKAVEGIVSA